MSKCIVLLYLFVCFVEKTYSLMCYTSDVNSYLSSNNTEHLKHKLQKCSDYVMAMHSSKTPMDSELHCYTISTDYPEIALKGCFPKGICDKLKKTFKDIIGTKNIVTFDIVGGIECNECDKDQCNWGSGFIPSYNSTANSALPTIVETLSTAASATINSTHDDDPTLLKCYFCSEPCDTSTALKSSCELSVEGVCTVEVPKDSKISSLARRGCQIVPEGVEPSCMQGSRCTFCRSDFCNAAPSSGLNKTTSSSKIPLLDSMAIGIFTAHFSIQILFH